MTSKLISIAEAEVGYLEKKSNSQLDDKTANAGKKNYTKYNRDYVAWGAGGMQPMEWCGAFASWCFVKAFGLEKAKELLCGGLYQYTPTGAYRFRQKGQYIKRGEGKPQKGDVVFFWSTKKKRIGHTGIVYKVDSKYVYTIEGNTSGASTLVENGGGVKKKSYKLTSTYIDGYGRPNYDAEEVKTVDIAMNELRNGAEGEQVKTLQILLNAKLGKKLKKALTIDGDFGKNTLAAVEQYQKLNGLAVDGWVGKNTWNSLLKG